uniref:RING-type domain-containing protein n=1 Tax=Rhodnius prolixus TaxID=13249 RepID=T1IBM3_RHOPR
MAGGGVNIGGYRMRVSVRSHSFSSAPRNNLSSMMLRSHTRRETSAQVMSGSALPDEAPPIIGSAPLHAEPMRETRPPRRFRTSNISSSNLRQRYVRNAASRNIGIGIQSLIRRDRTDPSVDLYDLEVRAEALEVLRSSLVLTLRSTGDVRVWLNILRQYREAFILPQHRNGQSIFKNLPSVDISEEDVQCSICLRDFKIGDKAKSLPCDHKFHSACIRPWLKRAVTCPMCRHHLIPPPSTTSSPPPALLRNPRRSAPSTRHRYVSLHS